MIEYWSKKITTLRLITPGCLFQMQGPFYWFMILIDPNEPFLCLTITTINFLYFHIKYHLHRSVYHADCTKIIQFHKNLLQTGETLGDLNNLNSFLFHVKSCLIRVADLSRSNKHSRNFACCSWIYRNYCTVPNIIKICMPWGHCDIGEKVYLSFHFFSECTQAGILKLS